MKLKFYGCVFLSLLLTVLILAFPSRCLLLAGNGLMLWFEKMIPALFPFMVLSGVIIRMNLTGAFVRFFDPVLGRLFQVNAPCVYGILIGFLCGFPMGAHVAAQLYEQKQISRREASFLLAFCNNIGPVYFLSFVLPLLGIRRPALYLFGMYGLPFLYGLFLRYTVFANEISRSSPVLSAPGPAAVSLLDALDASVVSGLWGIARLGGYMIFFNLLFILPMLLTGLFSELLFLPGSTAALTCGLLGCLLEITGGIRQLAGLAPKMVLMLLPFGGLSCIAQTYSMIRDTDLSLTEYVMHKSVLTAITVFFYLFRAALPI